MKLMYISLISIVCACAVQGIGAMVSNGIDMYDASSGIVLNTEGGIVAGKKCTFYKEQQQGVALSEYIVCEDGTSFGSDKLRKIEDSAATETSPYKTYRNYIGSYVKSPVRRRPLPIMLFGDSQLAVYYFDGEPQAR